MNKMVNHRKKKSDQTQVLQQNLYLLRSYVILWLTWYFFRFLDIDTYVLTIKEAQTSKTGYKLCRLKYVTK